MAHQDESWWTTEVSVQQEFPQCNLEEFLVIEHTTKVVELGGIKPILVQSNFALNLDHLQNDIFLSALGLSSKYH